MDRFSVQDGRSTQFGVIQRKDIDTDRFRAMSPATRLLYFTLLTFIGRYSGQAWPWVQTLGDITGISRGSTFRALRELRENGYIKVGKRGKGNLYKLLDPPR